MDTGKTDRRVRYTKRALEGALIELRRERSLSKISVKELCERADVNRSTFYAHYRNQYDLMTQIESEVLADLERYLTECASSSDNVAKVLEYAQANADLFIMLLDEGEGRFQRRIMELVRLFDLRTTEDGARLDDYEVEYLYLFAVSGALGVLTQWLRNGTPQSPEKMSELLVGMISFGIRVAGEDVSPPSHR